MGHLYSAHHLVLGITSVKAFQFTHLLRYQR